MNQDKLKLWIDALRSGQFEQAKGGLAKYTTSGDLKFCCLGVACEVAIKDGLDLPVVDVTTSMGNLSHRKYGAFGEGGFMPREVMDWLGFHESNVIVKTGGLPVSPHEEGVVGLREYVALLNDSGLWTFAMIADALEKTYMAEEVAVTNRVLVGKVLDAIEANLNLWDQGEYASPSDCGTTMCFGGWALTLKGYRTGKVVPGYEQAYTFHAPDGRELTDGPDIEYEATQVLGFDDATAYQVFHWQPEDNLPVDDNDNILASKPEQFEAFKTHVLAVTAPSGDTEA